jgi:hypothetical protein
MYKAKVAVCSEIHTITEGTARTMQIFLMLKLAVRKETARLETVNMQENARLISNGPFILYDLIVIFLLNLVKLEQGYKHDSCDPF